MTAKKLTIDPIYLFTFKVTVIYLFAFIIIANLGVLSPLLARSWQLYLNDAIS